MGVDTKTEVDTGTSDVPEPVHRRHPSSPRPTRVYGLVVPRVVGLPPLPRPTSFGYPGWSDPESHDPPLPLTTSLRRSVRLSTTLARASPSPGAPHSTLFGCRRSSARGGGVCRLGPVRERCSGTDPDRYRRTEHRIEQWTPLCGTDLFVQGPSPCPTPYDFTPVFPSTRKGGPGPPRFQPP